MCGLTSLQSLYALDSPFKVGVFDFSHSSFVKVHRIVEHDDGTTKIAESHQAIQKLQERRDQIHRVVLDHQAFLPPIALISNDVLLLVFDQAMGWGWEPQEGTLWAATSVFDRGDRWLDPPPVFGQGSPSTVNTDREKTVSRQ